MNVIRGRDAMNVIFEDNELKVHFPDVPAVDLSVQVIDTSTAKQASGFWVLRVGQLKLFLEPEHARQLLSQVAGAQFRGLARITREPKEPATEVTVEITERSN